MNESEPVTRSRLVAVLNAIAKALREYGDQCRLDGPLPSNFRLPACMVNSNDVPTAVTYMAEFGLGADSTRLRLEWDGLQLYRMREALAFLTWENPEEGRALQQRIEVYVPPVADEAGFNQQREMFQYAAIGASARMLETVRGILDALGTKQPRIQVSIKPPQIVIDGTATALDEQAAIYLDAVVAAGGQWVSGADIARRNAVFDASKVNRVWTNLPEHVQKLIETAGGKGSRLTQVL